MARITDLEQQIRLLINAPRKHLAIFQDSAEYHKLCSCLDVIGDTELAFHAHEEMSDGARPGSSYVLAYGFLQALFLQQDAVRNLYEALQLPSESDPLLTEIREVRNDAIGHPTKRGGGKGKSFTHISRPSISKAGFQLMTVEPNKWPPMFRYVSFKSLLDTQHAQLEKALEALLQALRKEEMEHREQFRDEKLAAIFPVVLHYYFEKVYESARERGAWEYGALHVSLISEIVETFKAALVRREIAGAYPGVEYQLKLLEYPLAQLGEYFAEKGEGRLNAYDAEIFTSFVEHEMSKLQEMALELDAEYAAEPQ
jgi:hypothetical protein